MEWSPQQDEALKAAETWLGTSDQQVFRLFGYAGTGKTTLARHLAQFVRGQTAFAAFTGKAAHVMRMSGCPAASTIHSLIYRPRDKSRLRLHQLEGGLAARLTVCEQEKRDPELDKQVQEFREAVRLERKNLSRPAFDRNLESALDDYQLLVIDECSMVDGRIGEDLLSFGKKIMVLGDPAQLPPVGGGGFFTNHKPDVMLTEIHRQARDNPIIHLASMIREGKFPAAGEYGRSVVKAQGERAAPEAVLQADQLLVGKNATRKASNRRLRQLYGRELEIPEPGDKLVCLRNNHDLGLLNGSLWVTDSCVEMTDDLVILTVSSPDGMVDGRIEVVAHRPIFLGQELDMGWWERKEAEEFDYGYALTVHKAQGSQWAHVMIFDESYVFREDRWRWLYTAVTRAADRVTIVRT